MDELTRKEQKLAIANEFLDIIGTAMKEVFTGHFVIMRGDWHTENMIDYNYAIGWIYVQPEPSIIISLKVKVNFLDEAPELYLRKICIDDMADPADSMRQVMMFSGSAVFVPGMKDVQCPAADRYDFNLFKAILANYKHYN